MVTNRANRSEGSDSLQRREGRPVRAPRRWPVVGVLLALLVGCGAGGGGVDGADRPSISVDYLALGDSFSSGEGTMGSTGECGQSLTAYPNLVARHLGSDLGRHKFLACTGARATDVEAQLDSVEGERFGLVTLTVGGNDVGFAEVLIDCLGVDDLMDRFRSEEGAEDEVPAELEHAAEPGPEGGQGRCDLDAGELTDRVASRVPSVASLYDRIVRDHLTDDGVLVVLGYPDIFGDPPDGRRTCDGFKAIDIAGLQGTAKELDSALSAAVADMERVEYRSVLDTFDGHGRCGDDPWLRGFALRPRVKSSFHPNELGHEALAEVVIDAIG